MILFGIHAEGNRAVTSILMQVHMAAQRRATQIGLTPSPRCGEAYSYIQRLVPVIGR
jgi:hypothetical protein